jgi:hypothetical protein
MSSPGPYGAGGWTACRIRDGDTYCRLVVPGDEELLVDLAGVNLPVVREFAIAGGL